MAAPTARAMITTMRAGGMPVDAVARILRIQRSDIHECLSNGRIGSDARSRLSTIFRVASDELAGEYRAIYRVWRRPVGTDGRSLLDLLTAGRIDESAIRLACRALKPSVDRYAAMERNPLAIRMEGTGNPFVDEVPVADLGFGR